MNKAMTRVESGVEFLSRPGKNSPAEASAQLQASAAFGAWQAGERLVTQRARLAGLEASARRGAQQHLIGIMIGGKPKASNAATHDVVQRVLEPVPGPEAGQQWNGANGLKKLLRETDDGKLYFESARSSATEQVLVEVVMTEDKRYELRAPKTERIVDRRGLVLFDGHLVTEQDMAQGDWKSLGRAGKSDYELVVQLGPTTYSFHVHPPQFEGRRWVPGQLMKGGRMTDTPTPEKAIDLIMARHPKPADW